MQTLQQQRPSLASAYQYLHLWRSDHKEALVYHNPANHQPTPIPGMKAYSVCYQQGWALWHQGQETPLEVGQTITLDDQQYQVEKK